MLYLPVLSLQQTTVEDQDGLTGSCCIRSVPSIWGGQTRLPRPTGEMIRIGSKGSVGKVVNRILSTRVYPRVYRPQMTPDAPSPIPHMPPSACKPSRYPVLRIHIHSLPQHPRHWLNNTFKHASYTYIRGLPRGAKPLLPLLCQCGESVVQLCPGQIYAPTRVFVVE